MSAVRHTLAAVCTLSFMASCTAAVAVRQPEPAAVSASAEDRRPLGIPPGHLPPPGKCRLWFPGRPPGHQQPSGDCGRLEREAPAGVWVLYRPPHSKVVHSRVIDPQRVGVVIVVRVYDAAQGTYLKQERAGS